MSILINQMNNNSPHSHKILLTVQIDSEKENNEVMLNNNNNYNNHQINNYKN